MPFMWNAFFKSFMIYDSKLNIIKKQITTNLIGLEMSRFHQVSLFRPFFTQQYQRNWRDVYICQERKTLIEAALTFLSSDLCMCVSCPVMSTLCDPMDYSPPGSSVHGILQARILEWVAIPFSRGSSQPRNQTLVSRTARRFFTVLATREAGALFYACIKKTPSIPAKVRIDN